MTMLRGGPPDVRNTKICRGFLPTGSLSLAREQERGSLVCELGSPIMELQGYEANRLSAPVTVTNLHNYRTENTKSHTRRLPEHALISLCTT
jgi:hypothetical protein